MVYILVIRDFFTVWLCFILDFFSYGGKVEVQFLSNFFRIGDGVRVHIKTINDCRF